MRIAIVHHYLLEFRGAERVFELLAEIFPEADLYTLLWDPEATAHSPVLRDRKIQTSFLQRLPIIRRKRQFCLPLFPLATEGWDLTGYDLVISSDSSCVKGVLTGPYTLHLCYCHTPMRYVWDMYFQYLGAAPRWGRPIVRLFTHYLRQFDYAAAQRVDVFIANSHHIARKIRKYYGREAEVIYPPVDTGFFVPDPAKPQEEFYLYVGAFMPYKRVDLIVEAFNRLGKPIKLIGDGPLLKALKRKAKVNVELLGAQPAEVVLDHLQRCRAFVFAAEEDFGIAPVEAQACGKPVIAYRKGGTAETVVEGETGVFFEEQSVEALMGAVERFERMRFDPEACRRNALRFSREICKERLEHFIREKYEQWRKERVKAAV